MPELPEVETIRRDLVARLLGQSFTSIEVLSSKTASHPAVFFANNLRDRKIIKLERRGKLLIFKLSLKKETPRNRSTKSQLDYLLIHLKMTGQLVYLDKKEKVAGGHSLSGDSFMTAVGGELPNKHTRAVFGFKNGGQLFFNDLRKFGYLKLVTAEELARLLKNNYGPEPLTKDFSYPFLKATLKNKKVKTKVLLLNQKLIAGLGNIYVDEALWAARVNPERIAGSLTEPEIKKLWQVINAIIRKAIAYRGTTFRNYVDSRGQQGNFSDRLAVYGRQGQSCQNCHSLIAKKKVAGRGTHYCPNCQK